MRALVLITVMFLSAGSLGQSTEANTKRAPALERVETNWRAPAVVE